MLLADQQEQGQHAAEAVYLELEREHAHLLAVLLALPN
jgi:hypothetical protein